MVKAFADRTWTRVRLWTALNFCRSVGAARTPLRSFDGPRRLVDRVQVANREPAQSLFTPVAVGVPQPDRSALLSTIRSSRSRRRDMQLFHTRTVPQSDGAATLTFGASLVRNFRRQIATVGRVPAEWSFLTNHGQALLCIAHDPGVRLRDIAATLDITERSAYGLVNDLTDAGYVVKKRDGRRNRYAVQEHRRLPEPTLRDRTVGEVLQFLAGSTQRKRVTATKRSTRAARGAKPRR